ncbi:hypothetical protein [Flavobacterium acetivorans]|uniref:hypothetical protein n=1 Tax=Flavobacterium acetivorans TaxID=2893883 RepID=UPI001E6391E9|nr:hypothetical protein [Flavobacterium sp. F-29]UFH36885.1 hypothetical protein LNP19_07550 [Flavobacterium sp. F-29]
MTQETNPMSNNTGEVKKINTIPLKEAKAWVNRWSKKEGHYNKHHELHAFLIPKIDLIEVLAEGVDAVRAYIGVDANNVEKLMIVGTKLNPETGIYEDMITIGAGASATEQDDIYDFSTPCPPAGDPESPLNQ